MENNVNNKSGKGLTFLVIILVLMVLGLGGYIMYSNVKSTDNTNTTDNSNSSDNSQEVTSYNSYNIGDKVTVTLNDSTEETFYVLKQSSKTAEDVTLFAEKNIGTGPFNNNYTDGNEYSGSLIESKVNELTSSWTNVKEKRLITVDEINATGLTSKKQCGPSESDLCDAINEGSWLKYGDEMYWTMTKAEGQGYDAGRYAYYVDLDGIISGHIVGYEPGSEFNPTGDFFANFGIRTVIVISKEYVK